MDKYTVNCTNCEEEVSSTYLDDNLWSCDRCGKLYDGESGRVDNITDREYYHRLYRGAKVAGMLNTEPEFSGDKEQMGSERW